MTGEADVLLFAVAVSSAGEPGRNDAMAGGIVALQRGSASRRTLWSRASAGDLARGLGWFSIALGVAELLAPRVVTRVLGAQGHESLVRTYGVREIGTGLGILASNDPAPWIWGRVGGDALDVAAVAAAFQGPRKGRVLVALAALASVTALDVMCGEQLSRDRGKVGRTGRDVGAGSDASEVERSITIGKSAEELYRRWRDPQTLAKVMAHFATVHASDNGRLHWRMDSPLGQSLDWDTEAVDDRPGEASGWRSLPGARAPSEGSIRFRPATGGRGTVATLRIRFDPPGGLVGEAVAKFLGGLVPATIADKTLHRFKSLVETGEIPTTERQPTARADPR